MIIERSLDIEDIVRDALKRYFTIYCRPLPEKFQLPSLLVTLVGGEEEEQKIDIYDVVIDSRAYTESEALNQLFDAVGTLKAIAESQTTEIRYVINNSLANWQPDPVRPELAMCSSRLRIYAHKTTKEL